MRVKLKPLDEQTLVITGATSGIGLVTARRAAARGARVVLASRNQQALAELEQEIGSKGGHAVTVAGDVARRDDIRRIADTAIERFGGFDTWVNDAGVSITGRLEEVSEEDSRRLFDTNFWGVVYGSLEAVRHLKERGGALINLGSVASDRAFPLQGMYCASKHAIKGFTDALRMELEAENAPVAVTLIKPSGIDTPFTEHARNYLAEEPILPPPVYPPEEVAEAILHAATHPRRDIFVGGAARILSTGGRVAPRATDKIMERTIFDLQKSDQPARDREGSLYRSGSTLRERGNYPGRVTRTSLYTRASLHPWATAAMLSAAGLALASTITRPLRLARLLRRS